MEQFTPQDFEIYDMHAHIFPDKISEKATLAIGKFYDIGMAFSIGDPPHLLEAEQRQMWNADDETKEKLQELYLSIEGELEDDEDE